MRKFAIWSVKAAISLILAFVILTSFCILYYNIPAHIDSSDGSTDYKWETNKFYSRATEGFACGKTNNDGYVNLNDYYPHTEIDILVLGSSHMEGFNVALEETTTSQLESLLGDATVYNLGMSGHNFIVSSANLENALAKYKPKKYVVIETFSLNFTEENLTNVIEGHVKNEARSIGGILGILQKNQYLRLMYAQFNAFADNTSKQPSVNADQTIASNEIYCKMLNHLSELSKNAGVQLIIVYHPKVCLDTQGDASTNDVELAAAFSEFCKSEGVVFIDMTARFLAEFQENNILPHGFSNTSVGSGHLNKYGHKMIAEEIYSYIRGAQ